MGAPPHRHFALTVALAVCARHEVLASVLQ
jgi:hypothetical protein